MISVKLQEKTKETQSICFREQLSLHRKYTVYKRAFLSASKWKMLSNIPFSPFLNGCLFRVPFMHSLRKASQINKRCYMSSIYKQTPSRNLNCSVICFPLLHSSRQTAVSPALPSAGEAEQRNLRVQTVQKTFYKYFRASELQNL